MESWNTAILEWVNCLDILEAHISDVAELRDGKFYAKLIKILSEKAAEDYEDDKDLVFRFIEDTYPEFFGKVKSGEKNCKEIYLASLLLLHASQEPKLHRPMCIKLSNETQIKIKSFLERVLNYGSFVTLDNINTAVMETLDLNLVRTPPVTPKMRPLKDFFNSPATTVRKNYNRIMDERTRELRALKAELETERFEKADLLEDLDIQRRKNIGLQEKLQEKIAEMKQIKEDSAGFDTPQSLRKKKDVKTPKNRLSIKIEEMTDEIGLLKSEIDDLQEEKQVLMRKLSSTERNCVTFKEKSKMTERNLETLLIHSDIKDQEIQELKNHNEELRSHIQEMRRQTINEQSFEMEMIGLSAASSSFNGSEVLSSVIEIQLQEAREETQVVKFQLEELNKKLQSFENECETLQQANKTLEAEVNLLRSTRQELAEARRELEEYIGLSNTLKREKLSFQEQTAKFEAHLCSKEKMLEEAEEQIETLKVSCHGLENKLKTTLDLFSKEEHRVKDLEVIISQKEQFIETEFQRFQDLDEKHTKLKQEKLELLQETESLKNLTISKEDFLQQAHQQIKVLELDLWNSKDKFTSSQELLMSEKTRCADLSSVINQMKVEHENAIESQLSRYRMLEDKYFNLEQENHALSQMIKNLNDINEILKSDLLEVTEKLKKTQYELAEAKKKDKELEFEVNRIGADMENQLAKYQYLENKHVRSENEKLSLIQDVENLNSVVLSKEQLLQQSLTERENVETNLRKLDEQFSTVQNSLADEKIRVGHLESVISRMKSEHEKSIELQSQKYQTLKDKYLNLEQERGDLTQDMMDLNVKLTEERKKVKDLESHVKQIETNIGNEIAKYEILENKHTSLNKESLRLNQNIENLNSVILSKSQLLEESMIERENLEFSLQKLNEKLSTVENSLDDEKTRVKDLESAISEMKLEYEKTLELQVAAHQSLKDDYSNLEHEKEVLFQGTKDLAEKNGELASELLIVNEELQNTQHALTEVQNTLQELKSTIKHNETDIKNQFTKYQTLENEHVALENEKLGILRHIADLTSVISSKEQLLEKFSMEKEHLASTLQELNEKLSVVEISLADERSRVRDLESQITRTERDKEEALESQLTNYRALEKVHINVEQDKINLLTENNYLKNLLTSKDEMLEKFQQQIEKLKSDSLELNKQLQDVQDILNLEQTKVKDLESEISQVRLQHREAFDGQILRYKDLEVKSVLLEEERISLLQALESSNHKLAEVEGLFAQSRQESETLSSKLRDLNADFQTVKDFLGEEESKVESLEFTISRLKQETQEILNQESTNYQTLDKKYIDLQQEKLSLLKDVENLKNLISSKEQLLHEFQQRNTELDSDLCSTKEELHSHAIEIKKLQSATTEAKLEIERLVAFSESLQGTINLLESTKQDLDEMNKHLRQQKEKLEHEKSDLQKDLRKLETHISSKEESLNQIQLQNEIIESKLKDMDKEIKSAQNLLNLKSNRVEELECTITHIQQEKEMTQQSQSMNYQALEQKYLDSEEEKMSLSKDIQNFRNLLSSKEELLLQSQQYSAELELDLSALKGESEAAENKLVASRSEIDSLESALAQIKLETSEVVKSNDVLQGEINLLKSARQDLCNAKERLHKQNENLQQEKLSLLKDFEKIKADSALKEESLKQTQEQNENLNSKLINLDQEMETVQNLLIVKSKRIDDLESVLAKTESERKESLDVIETLNLENTKLKDLIKSCSLILLESVKHCSRLTNDNTTNVADLTILDLSKELKTLLNSLEVIYNAKDSDLKNFEASLSALDSTISELKMNVSNLEEKKIIDNKIISDSIKEKEVLLTDISKLKKELSDEKSKLNLLTAEQKLLGRNLFDVKHSLILLKNEKTILMSNIEKQNQDLIIKIETISEIICKMQEQIDLDNKTAFNLQEEKASMVTKYNAENKLRMELEAKYNLLENENKSQSKEKKELKDKLNVIRVRNAKLEKNLDELRKENKKLSAAKPSTEEQIQIVESQNLVSKLQAQIQELETEKIELSKRPLEQDLASRLKEVHIEYDQKLERIKQKMKTAYNEQIEKVNRDQERLMQEKLNSQRVKIEEQCRKHAEEITKYKDHVTKLSSDYWDVGEKLLVEKQQKEQLVQQLQDLKKQMLYERSNAANNVTTQSVSVARSKTASLDRREFVTNSREEPIASRIVQTIKEEVTTCARRESIQSVQTMQGMGNAFKVEDEEGEIFNTNYLADMKAGLCTVDPNLDRLSVLQMRNAQCKPHLKSSYPAETQFQSGTFTEEEIKGNELKSPTSRILKERNAERRSTATPRRLKDLFSGSSRRQDENITGTPKGRRLSSIFRKPK